MYQPNLSSSGPVDALLDTSTRLFYEHGFTNVGVDTIVAESRVSKATLYRHFASKDALVLAVLRRSDEVWRENLESALALRSVAPRERLLAIFDWLGEWFVTASFRGCAFLNAAAELDPKHPAHGLPLAHKLAVRDYVCSIARDADLNAPEEVADELLLLIDGSIGHALLEGGAEPAIRAKRLAALALDADAKRGPSARKARNRRRRT